MRSTFTAFTRAVLGSALLVCGCVKPAPAASAPRAAASGVQQPPVAPRAPVARELHGDRRVDDYDWLRNRAAPEVRAYLEAENSYTRSMMRGTAAMQRKLLAEFQARTQHDDRLPSVRRGDWEYYARTEQGAAHPIYCRQRGPGAPEEVLLDLNALAQGSSYVDLGSFEVSDDGNYLAYSLDTQGTRSYTLYVKELRSGQLGPERIRDVGGVAWAADRTLFYTIEDGDKRANRVYRRTLGSPNETLVRQETDPRYALEVTRSRSKSLVFIVAVGPTATEVAFIPARQPDLSPQTIARRREHHEYHVDHRGGWFFIRTNDRGANFRVVMAPVVAPAETNWRELTPASETIVREELAVFADYLVVHEREAGLSQLRISELRPTPSTAASPPARAASKARKRGGGRSAEPPLPPLPQVEASYRIEMPEPVYELHAEENPNFTAPAYRFSYESLTTPTSYYEYRLRTHALELVQRGSVVAGYDPARYREERLHARAADGTAIPISLVYRADKPAGPSPTLLEAFGAYGYPFPTTFSSARVSLLDRGFVYAIAHVRGGGELGERWHDAGRLRRKRNSIDDFVTVAEHLIAHGYTTPDRFAIHGSSAGGLLIAAALNDRPELFRAALLDVPLVDLLNTMSDPELPLPASEYEEWGDPAVLDDYRYIKSYCPYTNIARAEYPTLMVKTSYDDSEVMYWESAKYVAKLRAQTPPRRPVLLWVNLRAEGDEGGVLASDPLRERAFDYAFLLSQVGRPESMPSASPRAAQRQSERPQSPTILAADITKISH